VSLSDLLHVAHSNQVSKGKALMGPSGVRANFCLKSKAKLSLKWRVKVGPRPFVSGSGATKGPDARVVQPGGPALHRAAVSATSIQPLPGVVP
jgi:hypothetical protein